MIEVKQLKKVYPLGNKQRKALKTNDSEFVAVNNLSLTCQPGRVFSLLGPNGAGKTSTLRLIATILKPSSGSITVNGHDVVKEREEVCRNMGFLTGSTELYERLTVKETLNFFGNLYSLSPSDLKKRIEYLFETLQLDEFGSKKIGQLSTGMKQRVSIARTMVHDPQVVVFDEPTSGLDVISAEAIINMIKDCREAGKTVIFSSHIMSEVDLLCDDLAVIHKGQLIYSDTMEAFRKDKGDLSLTQYFINLIHNANN